jgi:hypothetical protein
VFIFLLTSKMSDPINSENESSLFEEVKRGVMLLPTESGLKAFKLVLSNAEQINVDDIAAGEHQLIMTTKGQIETYAGVVPPTKFQSSMWRKSRSQMVVAMFTDRIFVNEAFYPVYKDGKVEFNLFHGGTSLENVLSNNSRTICRFGDDIPAERIPNLECMLDCRDFDLDGFLNIITYENKDGGDLDFGNGSGTIVIGVRSMGVKLGAIPTISRIPVHNMHGDGRWCIGNDSLIGCRQYPTLMHPGPLFNDLGSSPANADLDCDHHRHMKGVPILHSDPSKAPLMRIVPTKDYNKETFALSLPPIWPKIRKFQ